MNNVRFDLPGIEVSKLEELREGEFFVFKAGVSKLLLEDVVPSVYVVSRKGVSGNVECTRLSPYQEFLNFENHTKVYRVDLDIVVHIRGLNNAK